MDIGYRRLAAGVVHNALSEYWQNFVVLKVGEEENNKEAIENAQHELDRIEDFFKSELYTDIYCGIAPQLCRLKLSDFKKQLPTMYQLQKQINEETGKKKFFPVDTIFREARKRCVI